MSHPSQCCSSVLPTFRSSDSPQSQGLPDSALQFSKSVFLVGRFADNLRPIEKILSQLKCHVQTVDAVEQVALAPEVAEESSSPCLVIVADDDQQWTRQSVRKLRRRINSAPVTLVTLSDRQDTLLSETAAMTLVDGCLVNPINRSVLGSLVHSAAVRQFMHLMAAS